MKLREVIFHRPAHVIQVFRMINEYDKTQKSFADRRDQFQWRPVHSSSGYVADGELYLPEAISRDTIFSNCQLITIEDEADVTVQQPWKLINRRYQKGRNHCFNLHHPSGYELFSFRGDPPEVWLDYNPRIHGDPSREAFLLGSFKSGISIEVKINGKIDAAGRRYYKEQD
ncbi:MAG TPA: hypothetical protein VF145_09740, partial [Chitinophagaceae bacterium]